MFKGLRHLKISLAVKCQMLFGAAVVVIIAAAVSVPWQRMQQLTSQLNEKSAGAVATNLVAEHVERKSEIAEGVGRPETASDVQERPVIVDGQSFAAPRLVGLPQLLPPDPTLSKFKAQALCAGSHMTGNWLFTRRISP